MMDLFIKLLLGFTVVTCCLCSEVLRPRGVSLIKASLYDPSKDFRCLDGSATIPFRYVNDDFCDCRDGSDEPGTAACPNGIFYCANTGHQALDLRSSRVNDGVCDCCDASDEWASATHCTDVCLDLGRVAREEAVRMEEQTKRGYTLKLGMIEQGNNIKNEKQNKIAQIKLELEKAEAIKAQRQTFKEEAEAPETEALEKYREADEAVKESEKAAASAKSEEEAKEAFDSLDADSDGHVTKEEIQADNSYDTNRDGSVSGEEAEFYLQQSESVDFATFYSGSWRLMRPAYAFARRKPREGGATEQAPPPSMFTPPSTPPPPPPPPPSQQQGERQQGNPEHLDAEGMDSSEDPDDGYDAELYDEEEDDDVQGDDEEEEPSDEEDVEQPAEEEAEAAPAVVYDDETQALVDVANEARASFQEAADRVKELNRELTDETESLEKDYGPQDVFRLFEGNCYEYGDREYTYKLCPFDRATQRSNSGGGDTSLGRWGEWQDGYSAMKYTNGQGCWNGPNRSTLVRLQCGVENMLIGATEPSKCEYEFIFSTPAACHVDQDDQEHDDTFAESSSNADEHTEL